MPTESEQWFDEYLDVNGYAYTREPNLGVTKVPDRLIDRAGFAAVCEIKEFRADPMSRRRPEGGSRIGSFSAKDWFLDVRRRISNAAEQLKPLSGRGLSLVIILANPHGHPVPLGAPEELLQAMYGDLQITFRVDTATGAASTEPEWVLGEGGRLADSKAPYISGVAVLKQGDRLADWDKDWIVQWKSEHRPDGAESYDDVVRMWQQLAPALNQARIDEGAPQGTYFYVHLIETVSEDAVPVAREIFDGDRDARWAPVIEHGSARFEQVF